MGWISAVLMACEAGRRPMNAMGKKEGGTHFYQSVLGSVLGSRLDYVHFCLVS